MAGYFSNHSPAQSRFLANATTTNNGQSTTATSASSTTAAPNPPTRPRLPSAKFSSSVSSSDEKSSNKDRNSQTGAGSPALAVHPLRNTWVFWYRAQRAPGNKLISYEEGIKKIASFRSVESFWSLYTHLTPPSALTPTTDYLLFHSGVKRPIWEDRLNIDGGKWIVRLRKGVADRLWEDLVLAVIGEQFDLGEAAKGKEGGQKKEKERRGADANGEGEKSESEGDSEEWPEICGCTISVRQSEDIVSIWHRTEGDVKIRDKIKDTIRRTLNLTPLTKIEYKSNSDSMQDKSSFRNANTVDRPS